MAGAAAFIGGGFIGSLGVAPGQRLGVCDDGVGFFGNGSKANGDGVLVDGVVEVLLGVVSIVWMPQIASGQSMTLWLVLYTVVK